MDHLRPAMPATYLVGTELMKPGLPTFYPFKQFPVTV